MTKAEFLPLMENLLAEYGKQNYGPMRIDAIYREFSNLSKAEFADLLLAAYRKFKFAPTCAELSETWDALRQEQYRQKKLNAWRDPFTNDTASQDQVSDFMRQIIKTLSGSKD